MSARRGTSEQRVAVVGAGISGLVAGLLLARQGLDVLVFERSADVGGKMRTVEVAGARIDADSTVFTQRAIFDEIFASVGAELSQHVALRPLDVLARHAWNEKDRLDLHVDRERSAQAIGELAGAAEARRFLKFCESARDIYQTLGAASLMLMT